MTEPLAYEAAPAAAGIRSRLVAGINGLTVHLLEAGYESAGRPCLLLLHGFPELAYSWRKVMVPLADAGYHVVAPDQRGYGRTTGWSAEFDADPAPFRMLNLVRDALGLAFALGYRSIDAVIGHDFGSPVAAWCALLRPDVFRAVALMSAPFAGPPAVAFDTALRGASPGSAREAVAGVLRDLAALPRPRKHYQWHYSTREANAEMLHCAQGVHDFLRAYFHVKSADHEANRPEPLKSWSAGELARLPTYYVMDRDRGMAQTVAPEMPSAAQVAACSWLTEEELRVYSAEFARTGFQGGLNWYRCATNPAYLAELEVFSGRSIDVPALFVAGRSDWGIYQKPGEFERMRASACSRMLGCHLVERAGHWVQQEQPERVASLLLEFLRDAAKPSR